jgi:hypothetical protein
VLEDLIDEAEATFHHIQFIMYIRVLPMKGVKRFGMKGKLAPRYITPFPILEKCWTVACKLDLPPSLAGVNNIFHMSQLKKCLNTPVDMVLPEVTPLDADLTYPKHPIKILDEKDLVTRRKMSNFFKVQWSNHIEEKQCGKVRTSSVHAFRISSCHSEGTCDCSLSLLGPFSLQILGQDFFLGGGGGL